MCPDGAGRVTNTQKSTFGILNLELRCHEIKKENVYQIIHQTRRTHINLLHNYNFIHNTTHQDTKHEI